MRARAHVHPTYRALRLSGWITRQGVFFLYAALAVLSISLFALRVPGTRGRSLEDIQADLTGS